MIASIVLAATLSVSATNGYAYTTLPFTDGIVGIGCGETGDYWFMRAEDIAFLDEALTERRITLLANRWNTSNRDVPDYAVPDHTNRVTRLPSWLSVRDLLDEERRLVTGSGNAYINDIILASDRNMSKLRTGEVLPWAGDYTNTLFGSSYKRTDGFYLHDDFKWQTGFFFPCLTNLTLNLYGNVARINNLVIPGSLFTSNRWTSATFTHEEGVRWNVFDDEWTRVPFSTNQTETVQNSPGYTSYAYREEVMAQKSKLKDSQGNDRVSYSVKTTLAGGEPQSFNPFAYAYRYEGQSLSVTYSALMCDVAMSARVQGTYTNILKSTRFIFPIIPGHFDKNRISLSFSPADIFELLINQCGLRRPSTMADEVLGWIETPYYGSVETANLSASLRIHETVSVLNVVWRSRVLQ